jgi:ribonuclease HI
MDSEASPFCLFTPIKEGGLVMTAHVFLYTDGACKGNPGPGGYAAILSCSGHVKELTGGAAHTTNNRMELQAVIVGLQALKCQCQITVVTDSRYVTTTLNNGRARANLDLVQQVRQLVQQHGVTVQTVRGHSGHTSAGSVQALLNERADALAQQAAWRWMQGGETCVES